MFIGVFFSQRIFVIKFTGNLCDIIPVPDILSDNKQKGKNGSGCGSNPAKISWVVCSGTNPAFSVREPGGVRFYIFSVLEPHARLAQPRLVCAGTTREAGPTRLVCAGTIREDGPTHLVCAGTIREAGPTRLVCAGITLHHRIY